MSAAEKFSRPPFRQHAQCEWKPCGVEFLIKAPGQRFHSDACRYQAKRAGDVTSPAYRQAVRDRCKRWAAENRAVKNPQPWLLGAPIFDTHLPGGFLEMSINQPLQWPIEHRNVRALHAVITDLTGEHHEMIPRFALVPWSRGLGWGVYLGEQALLEKLAATRHAVRLFEHGRELRFGGKVRLKAPRVVKRGHRRLRIDTLTPMITRDRERPTAESMLNTMCAMQPRRIGIEVGDADATLRVIHSDMRKERVELGGKFGVVSGWVGHVVVDCNAVSEWLLRVAEVIGYGARVAYGFGRIRVSACE